MWKKNAFYSATTYALLSLIYTRQKQTKLRGKPGFASCVVDPVYRPYWSEQWTCSISMIGLMLSSLHHANYKLVQSGTFNLNKVHSRTHLSHLVALRAFYAVPLFHSRPLDQGVGSRPVPGAAAKRKSRVTSPLHLIYKNLITSYRIDTFTYR